MPVTPLERRRLRDAMALAMSSGGLEQFSRDAMRAIGTIIPTDLMATNRVDFATRRMTFETDHPEPRLMTCGPAIAAHIQEHPVASYAAHTGDGRSLRIRDFMSARQFRQSPIYCEGYSGLDCEDQLSVTLTRPNEPLYAIACNRGVPFTEAERDLLQQLRPHLVRGFRRATVVSWAQVGRAALEGMVADRTWHLLTVRRDGAVVDADPEARELLGDVLSGDRLASPYAAELNRVLVDLFLDGPGAGELQLGSLCAKVLPREDGSLVTLAVPVDLVGVARLVRLGLTRQEARVVALVAAGLTDAEIAGRLAISVRTVNSHLQHAYRLFRVSRRTALVAAVMGIGGGSRQ